MNREKSRNSTTLDLFITDQIALIFITWNGNGTKWKYERDMNEIQKKFEKKMKKRIT